MVSIKKLNLGHMRERRENRLCYNCDEKWGPGHKCKSARLFIMEGEASDYEELFNVGITDGKDDSAIEEVVAKRV